MISMCFVFFVLALANAHDKIDPSTLLSVFGDAAHYDPAHAASNIQVQAVTGATLVDPDYWDNFDDYTPSNTDYDKFDWTLTKRVAASSEENFLLSPLGLKLALAILTEAATGATQSELSSVLGFDLDRNIVRRKFASIIESLKTQSPEYILNLGSRIYIGNNAIPRQRFAAIAKESYKTELKTVDFYKPVEAAKEINGWVSNITAGRIPDLVDEADVANMVVLILNTLYFKGIWQHQFAPNITKNGPFYASASKQSSVPFMKVKDNFFFMESTKYDAKILKMPYRFLFFSADVANMVVLILNTLYFKGSWRHQFAPNATKNGPFYVSAAKQSSVPFMKVKDNFFVTESTKYDAKILRMPYRGHKFAMYIIVPNSISGLPRVLNSLSDLRLEITNLNERLVEVTLPKFKFDYTSQLDGILKELGVRTAFTDAASFPGIARGQPLDQRLRVSKVLQRSGIEVNELGSIAYTATEIALVNKFGEDTESNYEIVADKPFLFFIQDEPTRQLLFTGRVSNPESIDGAFKV